MSSRDKDDPAELMSGRESALPSGRKVRVRVDDEGETLEVRSPTGEIEVGIRLTSDGPVLQLRGVRLEIDSTDTVAVNCKRFELRADEALALRSGGDISVQTDADIAVRSEGQTHFDGDWVNINCQDREGTGWHDDPRLLDEDPGSDPALPEGEPPSEE